MRLVITGSRHGHPHLTQLLQAWIMRRGSPAKVYVGDCPTGVDPIAEAFFRDLTDAVVERFEANWDKYGPKAGPFRNKAMVKAAGPGAKVLAFPIGVSKGTWDCIRTAHDEGLWVWIAPEEQK